MDFNRKVNEDSYTDSMPEYPARFLASHCAIKGVQLGSVLGLVVTPGVAYFRKLNLITTHTRVAPISLIGGIGVSMGLLYYKYNEGVLDEAGVDDRAYRIANNLGQVTVDKYTFVGSLIGSSIGAILGRGGVRSILSATSAGVALSLAYYISEKQGLIQKAKDLINQQQHN